MKFTSFTNVYIVRKSFWFGRKGFRFRIVPEFQNEKSFESKLAKSTHKNAYITGDNIQNSLSNAWHAVYKSKSVNQVS